MRKYLALSALSLLLMSGSAFAAMPGFSGNVDASVGMRHCENTDDEECLSHFAYSLNGHVAANVGENYKVQLDAQHEGYPDPEEADDQVTKANALGLHVAREMQDGWSLGVFGAATLIGIESWDDDQWGGIYGIESLHTFDHVTVLGQLGYSDLSFFDNNTAFQGFFGRAVVSYFANPNLMFQGDISFGRSPDGYEDDGDWGEAWNFAGTVKGKVSKTMPLFAFATFSFGDYQANSEDSGSENAIMFGLSYAFGEGNDSLQASQAATPYSTPMLPGRATSWVQALD